MDFPARLLRAFCALALLPLGAASLTAAAALPAATQPLMWQQADAVHVLCVVGPKTRADANRLQDEICDTVRALAAQGAPAPVARAAFGDPVVLEPGTVTLLVHASVASDGDGRLVALDIRPFRPGGDQNAVLFGAAPRAVRIPGSGPGGDKLEAAIAAALAETLPWRQAR
ncbi:MAG: hypothetical protein QOJ91_2766 [Sphingomonadales bacterium]|jgi:hypothetical protein|nr:hypothetical protein [Sphingomonadales bacterium]